MLLLGDRSLLNMHCFVIKEDQSEPAHSDMFLVGQLPTRVRSRDQFSSLALCHRSQCVSTLWSIETCLHVRLQRAPTLLPASLSFTVFSICWEKMGQIFRYFVQNLFKPFDCFVLGSQALCTQYLFNLITYLLRISSRLLFGCEWTFKVKWHGSFNIFFTT